MSNEEIVRAWKDAEYRQRLSAEEQALLPEHPAGSIELTAEDLKQVDGGTGGTLDTAECCISPNISCIARFTVECCTPTTPVTQ